MYYFLDTSAVLHKGLTLFDNVYVSPIVLQELEKVKNSDRPEEVKFNAREAIRVIMADIEHYCCREVVEKINQKRIDTFIRKSGFLINNNDGRLIAEAALLAQQTLQSVAFVTADSLQYLFAKEIGDLHPIYLNEEPIKLEQEKEFNGWSKYYPTPEQLTLLYSDPTINTLGAITNEFCEIYLGNDLKDILFWDGKQYTNLKYKPFKNIFGEKIAPRNKEQKMLFHLLQNPDIKVKLALASFGSGKALVNSTIIPTPSGGKLLKDIQVGDYVFNRLGQPTKVLGVFPQGEQDVYKVTFSEGRTSFCNQEHLWVAVTGEGKEITLTTEELLQKELRIKAGGHKYSVPKIYPVQYDAQQFEIDPYVMGCFLNNGYCSTKFLTISSNDEFIVKEIARLIGASDYKKISQYDHDWIFRLPQSIDGQENFYTKTFFQNFPELLRGPHEKQIPKQYLYGSVEQRFGLLQGLLDTNGTIDKKDAYVRLYSTNYQLLSDVQFLCWSLGFQGRIGIDNRRNRKRPLYYLSITCTPEEKVKLFRLPRKKIIAEHYAEYRKNSQKGYCRTLFFDSVEKMPYKEEMTCLYVDDEEHIFLTENFIPTHNTYIMLQHALHGIQTGEFSKIIFVRNNIIAKGSKDIGFLPGEIIDKMMPYMMPIADLTSPEYLEELLQRGIIEPVPLSFMRGRDFSNNTLVFCDEAENLTKENIQLLIGRLGEGSQLYIAGDLAQIDDRLFEKNNGLCTMIKSLAGNELFGMVKLIKSERSLTSQLADLMD